MNAGALCSPRHWPREPCAGVLPSSMAAAPAAQPPRPTSLRNGVSITTSATRSARRRSATTRAFRSMTPGGCVPTRPLNRSGARWSINAGRTRRRINGAALAGRKILKEQDPITREVSVYHVQFMRSLDRPIFMDGRPHPPAWAPHTWTGFSTGEWVGNTLKVTTTHLKDGFLRRGSPQTTDMYAMTEFITRHDDILTIVTVIDDPIYLDQPYIHSTTYTVAQRDQSDRGAVQRLVRRERRDRPALGPALPAGRERGAHRVARQGRSALGRRPGELGAARSRAGRREDDLSGVPVDVEWRESTSTR